MRKPCQAGEICCPTKQQLFYLSQRPYLVTGTLRDQLLYPVPPARVWAASSHADQVHYIHIAGEAPQHSGLDQGERLVPVAPACPADMAHCVL